MNIHPLGDRVIVKRIEPEKKTSSGIIIPDTAQEKPSEAVVVAVGKGLKDKKGHAIELEVKTGDRVLIASWGGTEIKIENVVHLIMKESDILAIVK